MGMLVYMSMLVYMPSCICTYVDMYNYVHNNACSSTSMHTAFVYIV